jgi:hypothetical protein
MTLKRDNLVFPSKVSKPLGREKFFRLQVGREEKSLGTYALIGTLLTLAIEKLFIK